MSLPSPCIGVCRLEADGVTCAGCRRTLDEIAQWPAMDAARQQAVLDRLQAAPLPERTLSCARCGAAFVCGSGGTGGACWCMDLPPATALPAGGDCLCPACLTGLSGR